MNPFESPNTQQQALKKKRIKSIWAINRADMSIIAALVGLVIYVLLFG